MKKAATYSPAGVQGASAQKDVAGLNFSGHSNKKESSKSKDSELSKKKAATYSPAGVQQHRPKETWPGLTSLAIATKRELQVKRLGALVKKAATYSPAGVQYHRRKRA